MRKKYAMGWNWVNICGPMEPIRDAIPMKIMRETISKRYGVLERRKTIRSDLEMAHNLLKLYVV